MSPTAKRFGFDKPKRARIRSKQLNARIIRVSNTYEPGVRGNASRAVPNFVMQALGLALTMPLHKGLGRVTDFLKVGGSAKEQHIARTEG